MDITLPIFIYDLHHQKTLKSKKIFLANMGHQENFTILFRVPKINFSVKNLE